MKKLILFLFALILFGCSSPPRIRARDCKAIGNDIYDCEQIPNKSDYRR